MRYVGNEKRCLGDSGLAAGPSGVPLALTLQHTAISNPHGIISRSSPPGDLVCALNQQTQACFTIASPVLDHRVYLPSKIKFV